MSKLETIIKSAAAIEDWLDENAPAIRSEQGHLEEGSIARAYWHYGRAVALRDVVRALSN